MSKYIMGIDPGKSGAISMISMNGHDYFSQKLKDMTERDIFEYIKELSKTTIKCYIEKVNCMPHDGKKSIWSFSGNYHGLRMAVIGCGIAMEEVRPLAWQSRMKCQTKGDKNISKARAQQLFPKVKITHANADSLLIAEYGRF